MKPAQFEYHAAYTIDEAVALLAKYAHEDGRVIAGGQSLIPMMAFRLACPPHVIDINPIAELGQLSAEGGALRIGATVRHVALEAGTEGGVLGRLLATVARSIAHLPIRNRGTFCGSLVNADPASEWCLSAATLDGEVVARSVRGDRVINSTSFFQGPMTTDLAPDELVIECRIPLLADSVQFGFFEVSRRAGDFAMAAALSTYDLQNGRIADPKLGIGGVELSPRRLEEVEAMLAGAEPGRELFRRAGELAARVVSPMEDSQNTAHYRRSLTSAVVQRALESCLS
jgi:carbon-monoxide dehydrogenase medium subunit